MDFIRLNHSIVSDKEVRYEFEASENLKCFFSGFPFSISYPESIAQIPNAVLAVPFAANVLPIIWLTDSELIVDELDEAFFDCIPELKKGYETMFPESRFSGKITVKNIIKCDRRALSGKCAMFYSGGLDSVHTFISHFEEKPDLISIWGSDIKYDNEDGWNLVHRNIADTAQKYQLSDIVIRSSFREFDNEKALDQVFSKQLKDGWWHGVKHGIALLGHVAPYAYLHNISAMYIASSHCTQDGPVRCASNPLTDNNVHFADCKVIHDGFDFSRQDKTQNVVQFCNARGEVLPLHVCWKSQKGTNCCQCEKCYRTIAALIAEKADPKEFGFADVDRYIGKMREKIVNEKDKGVIRRQWPYVRNTAEANVKEIKKSPYWKDFKWILKSDFRHPETLRMPAAPRIKHVLRQCTNPKAVFRKVFPKQYKKLNIIKNKPFIMNRSDKQREEGLKALYLKRTGCEVNFDCPTIFNEKLQWYKLYYSHPDLSRIVCKVNFKKYIAEKLGDDTHTIPLIGAWTSVEDIPWDDLPDTFVLKSNAQSDGNCIKIIRNKADYDWNVLKKELKSWLDPRKTLVNSYCRAYYDVTPMILAEEYFEQFGGQLLDYKFFCFGGEPRFAYVASDHFVDGQRCPISNISLYDLEWNILPTKYGEHGSCITEPPVFLEKMVEVSRLLSKDFPFVRVDFFETADNWYLSELTFYPGGGFSETDAKAQEEWGKMLALPKKEPLGHKYRFDLNI